MAAGSALRFLPALGWTALIWWFGTSEWSAEHTERALSPFLRSLLPQAVPEQLDAIHWLIRKAGHVVEYGALAGLWLWALGGWGKALAMAVLVAALDELNQAPTFARGGSVADIALDVTAAGAALSLLRGGGPAVLGRLTGAFLWLAAGGGTVLLALHVAAAAPAGWLWLSVPAAWGALWFWRRQRRGSAPGPSEPRSTASSA